MNQVSVMSDGLGGWQLPHTISEILTDIYMHDVLIIAVALAKTMRPIMMRSRGVCNRPVEPNRIQISVWNGQVLDEGSHLSSYIKGVGEV